MIFHFVKPVCAAWTEECVGNESTLPGAQYVATITGVQCLLERIFSFLPGVIIFIAAGVIISAGLKIITADPGDSKTIAAAWSTITYAVIGLISLVLIWFALYLIEQFTGAPVTQFKVGV